MNFTEILDALEDLIENSWTLPMSGGRSVVDSNQVLEFVSDMRLALPEEMKKAKRIVSERDEILRKAKSDSEEIIAAAQAKARHLVSEQEVYKLAQAKANEVVTSAQNASKEMRNATLEYCDNTLKKTEEVLKSGLTGVMETRKKIR